MRNAQPGSAPVMKALAFTSAVLTGLLVVTVGWFVLRSDPLGGEPFAMVSIDPLTRPDPARRTTATPNTRNPQAAAVSPAQPTNSPVARQPVAAAPDPSAMSQPVDESSITLPPVPDSALVEKSRYGSLPKIAASGERPSQRYARPTSHAAIPQQGEPARIAILINGMGLSEQVTTDAINRLPAQVTLAFSPYGRNLQGWVSQARGGGHEVMLQIPLEPFDYPDNDPGPQTLLTGLTPEENLKRLLWLLGRFTGYTGITNHMGAKFAAAQNAFLPVLEELRERGLIYVDDGTSSRSTAGQIARDLGLGFSVAHVQIDAGGTPDSIDEALGKLETVALENGFAIGVGTNLPATIDRIATWAKALKDKGIVLIPVSAAVTARQQS